MSDPLFDLADRVIVVTGGMGQLGSEFCKALLQRGANVAACDVQVPEAARAERFGELADHERLLFLSADVTSRASLEQALERLKSRWGEPFGLVNAAAIDAPPNAPIEENGPFETYPDSSWEKVMAVNVGGVKTACQVFGGAMARTGRGSIVNIASTYGVVAPDQRLYDYRRQSGQPFYKPVSYSASKSALLNLTRYLAVYWAEQGVRVNTLTFGGVFNGQDDAFLQGYAERVPMRRMARSDEYNGAVIFLMSDAASYMTGSNMVIDGGWTSW